MESTGDPLMIRVFVAALSVVSWLREQWLLWLMLMTIALAYFSPVVLALSFAPIIAAVCTAVTFFLTGLTLPVPELRSLPKLAMPMGLVIAHCFIVAPLLGLVTYTVPIVTSDQSNLLLVTGLLCAYSMPTPMLVSTIATVAAGGSEATSQGLSVVANIVGLGLLSPLGVQLTLRSTGALVMPSAEDIPSFIWMFGATSLLPLLVGHLLQHMLHSSSLLKQLFGADEPLKRQITTATVNCAEICDTTQANWRVRARQLSVMTLLLLNYIIFSGLFHHSAAVAKEYEAAAMAGVTTSLPKHAAVALASERDKDITWTALGIVTGAAASMLVIQAGLAWMSTSCLAHISPEERIAAFFLCFQKSELLALPLLVQTCGCSASDPKAAGLLVLPCVLVHCIQSILGGLLAHPLRAWRNRQHCRPGTTLLPLRYTKAPKHAPMPTLGGASGSST